MFAVRVAVVLAPLLRALSPQSDLAPAKPADADFAQLERGFLDQGIFVDLRGGFCSIRAEVDIRDDLLEYLLVNHHGAAHESLFATTILGSHLNTALLALGAAPGKNARWLRKDPAPTPEEVRAGEPPYVVEPPAGDGFYLYAAWRADGELYMYRVEDLVRNLQSGRSMLRHRWVFLGSRMVLPRGEKPEPVFAADLEGNLVNIAFFEQGNTLATCALPECLLQSIWLPNAWLLPPRESPIELVFSREKLSVLPPAIAQRLPETVVDDPKQDTRAPQDEESRDR
ncbi:MAG: YdjY domain-containing protein [Planctomycetota bacterium]